MAFMSNPFDWPDFRIGKDIEHAIPQIESPEDTDEGVERAVSPSLQPFDAGQGRSGFLRQPCLGKITTETNLGQPCSQIAQGGLGASCS